MADIRDFGLTRSGQMVQAITLRAGDLTAVVLTWGAVLQSLRLAPLPHSLTLGSDHIADYEGEMRHHGALIGPVANRISGARARIDGAEHRFEANQGGDITLHSGAVGTHLQNWTLQDATDSRVTLSLHLPHGAGGFPGNRLIRATFSAQAPATFRLSVTVQTDAPTLINLANHSYWNLDTSSGWSGHTLRIAAQEYLPTTAAFTPTGIIAPVEGTPYDFRAPRRIAPSSPALDTCFCLSDRREPLRDVLWLTGTNGTTMTLATTEPGVQVYDGRGALRPGRAPYEGLAIEPQFWPDAPNHADFPDITLAPGQPWTQISEWRFATA